MLQIDGYTQQLGIIGNPVEHSLSPKMHNFISDITGNNFVYSAWCVEDVKNAVHGIRALGISGVNVTAPHKQAVMEYLDKIDDDARLLGSVNTIVNRDGCLIGYNTDADGFCLSLSKNKIEVKDKNILVLGAGGVVSPTLLRLIRERPTSITVLNRTKSKVTELKDYIFKKSRFLIETETTDKHFDIVINTTSAGMAPQAAKLPTDFIEELSGLDFMDSSVSVIDMIYNPPETLFLKEAKKHGAKTMNGLGMLICQGILSYELFTGVKLPENIYDKIEAEILN